VLFPADVVQNVITAAVQC